MNTYINKLKKLATLPALFLVTIISSTQLRAADSVVDNYDDYNDYDVHSFRGSLNCDENGKSVELKMSVMKFAESSAKMNNCFDFSIELEGYRSENFENLQVGCFKMKQRQLKKSNRSFTKRANIVAESEGELNPNFYYKFIPAGTAKIVFESYEKNKDLSTWEFPVYEWKPYREVSCSWKVKAVLP